MWRLLLPDTGNHLYYTYEPERELLRSWCLWGARREREPHAVRTTRAQPLPGAPYGRRGPHRCAALLVEQLVGACDHRRAANPATELLEIRRTLNALSNITGDGDPTGIQDIEYASGHRCCSALELSLLEGGSLELIVLRKHLEGLSCRLTEG